MCFGASESFFPLQYLSKLRSIASLFMHLFQEYICEIFKATIFGVLKNLFNAFCLGMFKW